MPPQGKSRAEYQVHSFPPPISLGPEVLAILADPNFHFSILNACGVSRSSAGSMFIAAPSLSNLSAPAGNQQTHPEKNGT